MQLAPRAAQSRGEEKRIHVVQGEFVVSSDPTVVLTTILGSCVAACVWDAAAGVGGMNHFLLPGDGGSGSDDSLRYGVHSMELLLNSLLKSGARRDRLEAKLFGGGRMMQGLTDIGELNAAFAEDFLQREGISLTAASLRGDRGRRIQFWPVSGRARQIVINHDVPLAAEPIRSAIQPEAGALELF